MPDQAAEPSIDTSSASETRAASPWMPPGIQRLALVSGGMLIVAGGAYGLTEYFVARHFSQQYQSPSLFTTETVETKVTLDTKTLASNAEIASADQVKTSNWPCLFGPSQNSRAADQELVTEWPASGPPMQWRVPTGAGYSSPIAADGRVIHHCRIGDEEVIFCRELETGKEIWNCRYPTTFQCGTRYTSGPYSTPVIEAGRVYALGVQGQLHCLKLATGHIVWQRDLGEEFDVPPRTFGVGHSPVVWQDRVIVNVGGQKPESGVVAFQKDSGELLWQTTDYHASYATPRVVRIHDRDLAVILTREALICLDPLTGQEFWNIPFESTIVDGENAVTPMIYGDLVLVCSYGTGTLCLRIKPDTSYEIIYGPVLKQLTSQYVPVVCKDGYVYGVHTDFSLRCMELATGKVQWRIKQDFMRCNQILIDDRIIAVSEHGHLFSYRATPEEFQILSETIEPVLTVEGHCFQSPAAVDGRLLIGSEQELVCFDLRPPRPSGD